MEIDKSIWRTDMKRFVIILIAYIFIITLVGCAGDTNEHIGEAKTPSSSSAQEGRDYLDVIEDFEKKGFVNIKTLALDD